jgi:hypothetical protein
LEYFDNGIVIKYSREAVPATARPGKFRNYLRFRSPEKMISGKIGPFRFAIFSEWCIVVLSAMAPV